MVNNIFNKIEISKVSKYNRIGIFTKNDKAEIRKSIFLSLRSIEAMSGIKNKYIADIKSVIPRASVIKLFNEPLLKNFFNLYHHIFYLLQYYDNV